MPRELGPYILHIELGRGGMGEVWRAHDARRQRDVALKLLPRDLVADPETERLFRRESQIVAQLHSPHVIPIHDFGEIDGQPFIDMRLVEGIDLSRLLRERGAVPVDRAVEIVRQVASALDAAHDAGVLHRDVKPSNILLSGPYSDHPFAYLADFGIATRLDGTQSARSTGVVGTLTYVAPERFRGVRPDRRSDVYSLACVLYESLSAHSPFPTADLAHLVRLKIDRPPLLEPGPALPAGLAAVVARGMAIDPDARPATAGEFAREAADALVATVPVPFGRVAESATPPVSGAPDPGPDAGEPSRAGRRPGRRAALLAVAGVVVAAGVVIGLVVANSDSTSGRAAGPTDSSSAPAKERTSGPSATGSSPVARSSVSSPSAPLSSGRPTSRGASTILSGAPGYRYVSDPDYGYRTQVPTALTEQPAGSGRETYTTDGGAVTLQLLGTENGPLTATAGDELYNCASSLASVREQRRNGNAYTCAGVDGDGHTFYEYGVVSPRTIQRVRWVYPNTARARDRWANAVRLSVDSFVPGRA